MCQGPNKLTIEKKIKVAGVELNDKISSFIYYFPCRAQPKKKKKVDVKKEQAQKERMKKRLKKLEKAAPELIPIEDFITPLKYSESNRSVGLPFTMHLYSQRIS